MSYNSRNNRKDGSGCGKLAADHASANYYLHHTQSNVIETMKSSG